MIYFSADHHFGHEAIIEYCNRPFKNVAVMDKALIKNHNAIVADSDDVFFVGDFSLKTAIHKDYLRQIIGKLNGKKHLILGNHDKLNPFDYVEFGFLDVHTSLVVDDIVVVHDPACSCIDRSKLFVCGHVHDLFVMCLNVINVSVEV